MTRTMTKARGDKAKCDVLFSKIIRSRGACEKCGDERYDQLQTSHVISRRYSHTRTYEGNAQALCAACHSYFTDHPVEFGDFVMLTVGRVSYMDLMHRSRLRTKFDWSAELERLRAVAAELELV